MDNDVLPRRNLPPQSEEWGRRLEQRTDNTNRSLLLLNQQVNNESRANAGQLAQMGNQLTEIVERSTLINIMPPGTNGYMNPSGTPIFGYWSNFKFTLTKPRNIVMSCNMVVNLRAAAASAGNSAQIWTGVETQSNPNTIDWYSGGLNTAISRVSRTTVGTTYDAPIYNISGFRLLPGEYSLWFGLTYVWAGGATDAGGEVVGQGGVGKLEIGPPDTSIIRSDLPVFNS